MDDFAQPTRIDPRVAHTVSIATSVAAWLVIAVGTLSIVGYAISAAWLVSIFPTYRGMSLLTATMLIMLALSLLGRRRATVFRLFPWCVVGGALATLAMRNHGDDLISPWLTANLFPRYEGVVGKVSASTAAALLLLAFSIINRQPPAQRVRVGQAFAGVAAVVSGFALLCYAYGVNDLYALGFFREMALHTAASVFLLAFSSFFMEPAQGWSRMVVSGLSGGRVTRRQLLFTALSPLIGWLLISYTDEHKLGAAAAMALLVALTFLPLFALILRDGWVRDQLDLERQSRFALLAGQQNLLASELARQREQLAEMHAEKANTSAALAHAQRMDTLGRLSGGIAHDFNNLLMSISGSLELVSERLDRDHPGTRMLINAKLAAEKGAGLTKKLLAFSRTQQLTIGPVAIQPALHRARDLLGSAMGPNITVVTDFQTAECWIDTDPDQLDLALLNLAVNARDAMPGDGVLMLLSDRITATLPVSGEQPCVRISVVDNGSGMDTETASRAIEPFFTTKDRGRGTGLGLAQAYGFVRQCRGDLRIISELGEGTRIDLYFPLAQPATERVDISEAYRDHFAPHASASILVVDDDTTVRAVLVTALTEAGYRVTEAENGEQGLKLFGATPPALVVLDFLMPGMNGADVAREMRARVPQLPIVFVSGFSDTLALADIDHSVVLRKPFELAALVAAVTKELSAGSSVSLN